VREANNRGVGESDTVSDQRPIAEGGGNGNTPRQTSLTLEMAGKPDAHCFVDAPNGKRVSDQVKDITLEKALNGLGFLNLFRTVHEPPKIMLDFDRKCQFSTPPYLYGSPQ
jgi:hypothetical protein